jgi:micrococcal nuclease
MGPRILIFLLLWAYTVACADSEEPSDASPTAVTPTASESSEETTLVEPRGDVAEVVRVLDGDTIDVLIDGEEDRVRYIGVDSPESGACLSDEATAANARLVAGQTVLLEADPDGERDRFDRLLRYVYVGDVFVNAELVRLGLAEATTRFPEQAHREELLNAEREAFDAGRGIWSACPGFGQPPG